jgi:proline racemase
LHAKRVISIVGCHAEGEVGDVIVGGVLPPPGATMFERMTAMERDQDHLRRLLLCEPRGSVARHVNLITPPARADCDIGMITMEPTEFVPMSGSNLICTVTVALETGILEMREPETIVRVDAAAGLVIARASCRNGKCESVAFANVPSFVGRLDAPLEIESLGTIKVDIAYGGMWFALVDAAALGFRIEPAEGRDLALVGEKIRLAARAQLPVVHPENPQIRDVSIVQFDLPFQGPGNVTRNTCIVAPGRSDRSPCGTGTSARLAVLHARGLMKVGDSFIHESIIGSRFKGAIIGETTVGGRPAILPAIEGRAWITGLSSVFVDPADPWPEGYVLADTWGATGKTHQ